MEARNALASDVEKCVEPKEKSKRKRKKEKERERERGRNSVCLFVSVCVDMVILEHMCIVCVSVGV